MANSRSSKMSSLAWWKTEWKKIHPYITQFIDISLKSHGRVNDISNVNMLYHSFCRQIDTFISVFFLRIFCDQVKDITKSLLIVQFIQMETFFVQVNI